MNEAIQGNQDLAVLRLPILLKAHFTADEYNAVLRIRVATDEDIVVTVIHESRDDANVIDILPRDTSEAIYVRDQESLSILARHHGRIVASGVYEIDMDAAARIDVLLVPCCESGLVVAQVRDIDQDGLTKAIGAILDRHFGPVPYAINLVEVAR